jgi:hypothetical protein
MLDYHRLGKHNIEELVSTQFCSIHHHEDEDDIVRWQMLLIVDLL